jgi:MFS family permease
VPILFAVTLFVSALLLFMVQPMIGRMILPLLGGSPAAWNTCMVFFQFVLLLGYLYADWLSHRYGPRRQVAIHLAVLGTAIVVFALAAAFGERHTPIAILKSLVASDSDYPIIGVLGLLGIAIGIPFFAVSTTAPLLQHWFSKTDHPAARDPYFLYAASNVGSLLSLLAYPLITEPSLTINQQAWAWAIGFALFLGLVLACGKSGLARCPKPDDVERRSVAASSLTIGRMIHWIALAFVPSSLMIGVTTYMTTDIASIPLLWVIPLALYLITFIIAFARMPKWFRLVLANAAPVVTLLLIYVIITGQTMPSMFWLLGLHLITYFLLSLMCHCELAHDRPEPALLTKFFLLVSVGGVLGGIFNAILAPLLFPLPFEYSIALAVGCFLVPRLTVEESTPKQKRNARMLDFMIPLGMLVAVMMLEGSRNSSTFRDVILFLTDTVNSVVRSLTDNVLIKPVKVADGLVWAVPLIVCFFFIDRPIRFGLCVAAILVVGEFRRLNLGNSEVIERSYFGILKVDATSIPQLEYQRNPDGSIRLSEKGRPLTQLRLDDRNQPIENSYLRSLVHGTTLHGKQGLMPFPWFSPQTGDSIVDAAAALVGPGPYGYDWPRQPLTYYHRTGPVGHLFRLTSERQPHSRVAMVGLGTGSVACYANSQLDLTFYEIDPTVKRLVFDTDQHFTYVTDAKKRGAKVDCVLGDARLKLEQAENASYDLLLVDAFSSDAIPIHLITREAMSLYMNRVSKSGLLALHISNKYINLEFPVAKLAESLGLAALVFNDSWRDAEDHEDGHVAPPGKTQSTWVVLARDVSDLQVLAEDRFQSRYDYVNNPIKLSDGTATFRPPTVCMWQPLKTHEYVHVWTDDYADVLMVMTLREVQRARRFFGLKCIPELVDD